MDEDEQLTTPDDRDAPRPPVGRRVAFAGGAARAGDLAPPRTATGSRASDDDEAEEDSPFGKNPGRSLVRQRPTTPGRPLDDPRTVSYPVTGDVRIDAVAAAVAAGIASERPAAADPTLHETGEISGPVELPDWSDPPTGQVPRVLLDDSERAEAHAVDSLLRGPSWREGGSDWDDETDLSFLSHEEDDEREIAGRVEPVGDPFEFAFEEVANAVVTSPDEALRDRDDTPTGRSARAGDDDFGEGRRRQRPPHHASRSGRRAGSHDQSGHRSPVIATLTGFVIAAFALGCFLLGSVTTLLLVTLVVTLAAAEVFSSLRRAGYRPATLVGLLAVPTLVIGCYLHGPVAVPFVLSFVVFFSAVWSLAGLTGDSPIANLGVTAFVICWAGVLGSFAALLLAPAAHPHRHGVAYVLGAVILTVAHDVGSYIAGSVLGRHQIAPRVSPGKTREGLAGGTLLMLLVAGVVVSRIHPFGVASALELGALVAVVAPVGDLLESVVKRDLGLKDMGRLLPAHGGVFDRIDAMLFVLPACYYLVRLHGLA